MSVYRIFDYKIMLHNINYYYTHILYSFENKYFNVIIFIWVKRIFIFHVRNKRKKQNENRIKMYKFVTSYLTFIHVSCIDMDTSVKFGVRHRTSPKVFL